MYNQMNTNMFGANLGSKRPLFGEEPDTQGWLLGNQGLGGDGQQMENGGSDRKKKRRSRWNTENDDKTVIPGMPTVIPSNLSEAQQRQYVVQLQIEEITRKLRTGELGIPSNPEQRSPSPEPIYNNEGKRLNTREYRTRKKLEEERHKLIQEALKLNTDFKPPSDYKPPVVRVNDKVMIPQEEHPEINFVGLLIGPRGNTLKTLEKDTGAKIIIRGKGSVKDGKIGRKDGQPLPGEDEPLHAYVTANNPENVKKAVEQIKEIIKQGIEVPEGQNDLRRQQLRELALLNGTLRENDGLQKLRQIAESQTIVTNTIICTICGGTGHIAQDCKQKRPGDSFRMQQMQNPAERAKMDSEYMSLMAELGEGPLPSKSETQGPPSNFGQNQSPFNRPLLTNPPPNPMAVNPPWQMPGNRPPMTGPVPPPPSSSGPPLLSRPPMGMQSTAPQINPMGRLPMPLMTNNPPGGMQQGPPPNMLPPPPGQQMGNMQQLPPPPQQPHQQQQQHQPLRPWQQPASQAQPMMNQGGPASTASMGMPPPPPGMMSAPPPPPVSTQGQMQQQAPPPWMQHQPQQHGNMQQPPPPPPPTSSAAPWQQQQQQQQQQQGGMGGGGAPPPPPVSMAPWQQHHPPPHMSGGAGGGPPPPPHHHPNHLQQQQQQQPQMSNMMGGVPPPNVSQAPGGGGPGGGGGHQFNNYGAPPPPPPMNFNNQRMGGMMMPVPPPPPPPSS